MFREPPNKRRRGNNPSRGGKGWETHGNQAQHRHQHWDEPANPLPAPAKKSKPKRYTINHELTQEEVWDDSALIEAWDAAVEEYESLNGPGKAWKEEPVHKSALWYAPPPKPQESDNEEEDDEEEHEEGEEGEVEAGGNALEEGEEAEVDSAPIDFNTFVPSHDPTLGSKTKAATVGPTLEPYVPTALSVAVPDAGTLTRDEIFEKAVSASYWAGYWTAMYHASTVKFTERAQVEEEEAEADEMVHIEESANVSQTAES
ncbi:hypothetical protein FRC06_006741 [Ceratobasidium sp. 370]|nr:hypothetical protein FRC06_006741 [Ceratobasidium sp. 370]